MQLLKNNNSFILILLVIFLWSCKQESQWKGQEAIKKVSTETVPIQLQYRGTFDLGEGVFVSNNFAGARLNGIARTNDTLLTVLITPENTPINGSPWYAFKIWSETETKIHVNLTYSKDARHRYHPKLSLDGVNWNPLDSANFKVIQTTADEKRPLPTEIGMSLLLSPDTLWISAQELITSAQVDTWINHLDSKSFVSQTSIGQSIEGRSIRLLKIGESKDQKMLMIMARQHPPEVPGFMAMQAFVETICSDSKLAENFRKEYTTYVVPLANPDGVYHGHWRHNRGGIDLNRDWADFNQPETSAIRDFMKQKTESGMGKFYVAIDFHSTQEDIYYTINPEQKGNMPGIVEEMIVASGKEFPDYEPNVRPSAASESKVTSTSYFFYEFGAESLTYEVGDHTPREFVQKKAMVSAIKLMEGMLK